MTTLITRLSQAIEPTRELLEAVAALIWNITLPVSDWSALHWNKADRFTAMLDAEAWTSAVEMLLPARVDRYPQAYYTGPNPNNSHEGHRWELWAKERLGKPFRGHHAHSSALALAIACLKARGLS